MLIIIIANVCDMFQVGALSIILLMGSYHNHRVYISHRTLYRSGLLTAVL